LPETVDRLNAALVDRYTIERKLGEGGWAIVYLAYDLKHERQVALKVLKPELAHAIGSDRFLREIKIVARLRHPHIVPLLDSGTADLLSFYAMPFVEGESLRGILDRERQLAIDEAVRISCEVADALVYAHSYGVVHRDIKPENIMFESGHAVVTDFGVASAAYALGPEHLTETGLSLGTPQYMSPEQASGDRQVDGRSDMYSLACVLYELLAGDPPFVGTSVQALLARKMMTPVPSLRAVRETVSEPLERVIFKALARTPADRFKTAAEFAQALRAAPAEQEGGSSPQPQVTPTPGDQYVPSLLTEVATPPAEPDAQQPRPRRSIGAMVGIAAVSLLVAGAALTALGLLTTAVFDIKLSLPAQFTPSRSDFPILGLRTLVPFFFYLFALLAAHLILRSLGRLLGFGAWLRSLRDTWVRIRSKLEPGTIAEAFFLVALVLGILALRHFWPLVRTMWTTDTEVLACSYRPLHRSYSYTMAVLIVGLSYAWYHVFKHIEAGRANRRGVPIARWGSLVWLLLLLALTTMPWRLLWAAEYPRVLVGGERAYILTETDSDLVIYNAEQNLTEHHRKDEPLELERRNTTGYLFEEPEAFDGERPGC